VVQNQSDASPEVPTVRLHVDEEHLPFRENMFDLVISSLRYSASYVFCCICSSVLVICDCFMGSSESLDIITAQHFVC